MICPLCDLSIKKAEQHRLTVRGKEHYLHKKCLRKATKQQLVDKKIIESTDHSWRLL